MLMKCGDANNPDGPGRKSNGEFCNNPVTPGSTRCHLHGSKAPEALIKAKTQLALLRMPAIEALHAAIEQLSKIIEQFQSDTCLTCNFPRGDAEEKQLLVKSCTAVSRIAVGILDRTDIGPKHTLEVKQNDFDIDLRELDVHEQQELDQVLAQYEALKLSVQRRLHGAAFGVDASTTIN